jgi:competence protein ComEC
MGNKLILTGVVLIAATVWLAVLSSGDKNLHLVACDVGQGDAILAVYGTDEILVDGGPDSKVLECLSRHLPFWDREIEIVVISHPQKDHFGGLVEVFERYQVDLVVTSGLDASSQEWQVLKEVVGGSGADIVLATSEKSIRLGEIYLDVVWPSPSFVVQTDAKDDSQVLGVFSSKRDPNDFSVVANLRLGDFDALLTGDIGPEVINEILNAGRIHRAEYIKVPHHGSKNGLTQELLDTVEPEVAVISVGKNSFGHPHQEILEMLETQNIKTLRTDKEGDVELITDGEKWWLK